MSDTLVPILTSDSTIKVVSESKGLKDDLIKGHWSVDPRALFGGLETPVTSDKSIYFAGVLYSLA